MRTVPILPARRLLFCILNLTPGYCDGGSILSMKPLIFGALVIFLALTAVLIAPSGASSAGGDPELVASDYKLMDPITHGNLTVFPVVSARSHDTSQFLTLDEGIRSGEVVVTEVGNLHTMVRRHPLPNGFGGGARVNNLVLVNNSERPLILLAGGNVTGGGAGGGGGEKPQRSWRKKDRGPRGFFAWSRTAGLKRRSSSIHMHL